MFNTIRNAWRIPDLRKKILYTLLIIIVFRFGSVIPAPFLDASALSELMASAGENSALGYINMLTGGAFSYASLFAMGITPYINSSIIMQLLTIAIPLLERMAKEGEEGRKKIATITRYVTVILGLIQGVAYYFYLRSQGIVEYTDGFAGVFVAFVIVLTFTAGTALIMWMGEQINDKGVGNGISIILFAGIVARLPVTFGNCVAVHAAGYGERLHRRPVSGSGPAVRGAVPGGHLGHRLYERGRAPHPRAVRQEGCGPQDVWRPEHLPAR